MVVVEIDRQRLAVLVVADLLVEKLPDRLHRRADHLPFGERGGQEVLDISLENLRVRGTLDAHRLAHYSLEADRSDQCGVLAAVASNLAVCPLSLRRPRPQARHRGVKPTLVDEYQPPGVAKRLASHFQSPLTSSSRSWATVDFF